MTDRFDRAGAAFANLCRIMAKLRAPGGCPWDREQTLESLKPYLIEEAYEVLEAIDHGPTEHREELGDLLLQVVFQAELTQEEGAFDIAEVADGIVDKLVRRHPHVFGDKKAADADGALANWEAIKAGEKPRDKSVLAGVPTSLPALLKALRTGEKAAAVGFDWPNADGAMEKVEEEWREFREAIKSGSRVATNDEAGDLFFALVNVCRHLGLDPENALRQAIAKFSGRFQYIEARVKEKKYNLGDLSLDELNELWVEAKQRLVEGN